jgi:hypothetical protein
MRVALHTTFAASKKEPLADLLGRIHQAFLNAGLAEPTIWFTFTDSVLTTAVSSVDRVLKRHPEMEQFLGTGPQLPGTPADSPKSRALTGSSAPFPTLHAIAAGVPRSYPFRSIAIYLHAPAFGEEWRGIFPKLGKSLPGIFLTDNSWVKGRQRYLCAYTEVEVDPGSKKLPPHPEPVAAVMAACGKAKQTTPVPSTVTGGAPLFDPAKAEAIRAIVADYRARMKEVVDLADMPHDLPPGSEIRPENAGVLAGPRKPALETAFTPMGYTCRGGSGTFTLTRRTSGNLTAELYLDVGTWSHQVSAIFHVQGLALKASLVIPVTPREIPPGQYPIGDAEQWQKIVENLAAMVRELDRSFVPEIEQIVPPAPAWYQPAT